MDNPYESRRLLDEYLLFHYGAAEEVLPVGEMPYPPAMREALGFPLRTAMAFSAGIVESGLDLGCAVGGSTFAMAQHCRNVLGVDFSESFITTARALQRGENISYQRVEEGTQSTELVARMPLSADSVNVRFEQGDAMNLRADIGTFQRVHAANLLCRLSEPLKLVLRFKSLVAPGGELLLATPCTWLENFTPPAHWPSPNTMAWLQEILQPDFTLQKTWHEPFLIRESARKFQWSLSQVSLWKKH